MNESGKEEKVPVFKATKAFVPWTRVRSAVNAVQAPSATYEGNIPLAYCIGRERPFEGLAECECEGQRKWSVKKRREMGDRD